MHVCVCVWLTFCFPPLPFFPPLPPFALATLARKPDTSLKLSLVFHFFPLFLPPKPNFWSLNFLLALGLSKEQNNFSFPWKVLEYCALYLGWQCAQLKWNTLPLLVHCFLGALRRVFTLLVSFQEIQFVGHSWKWGWSEIRTLDSKTHSSISISVLFSKCTINYINTFFTFVFVLWRL